jgi:hypothetical protein
VKRSEWKAAEKYIPNLHIFKRFLCPVWVELEIGKPGAELIGVWQD